MKTHVEFRSDQFPPYEGEADEVNPGVHGWVAGVDPFRVEPQSSRTHSSQSRGIRSGMSGTFSFPANQLALDHFQSAARRTRRRRTGFM